MAGSVKKRELLIPIRTILVVSAAIGVLGAFVAIGDTFLIVFIGIFLGLVFEFPVRFVIRRTGWSRGLAATVTVLGTAIGVVVIGLLFLVPMVGSVRDFLHDLPQTIDQLRSSSELSWLGDTGIGKNLHEGADKTSVSVPDAVSQVLGIAGDFFTVFLVGFTILFICLFFLSDVPNMKRALGSVLMPGEDERWLGVWERVTESVSRWAIGVVVIATIAGTTQGVTAWLLGSSFALGLGVIAGLLDMIPNLGATLAGFILVPAIWAESGIGAAIVMLIVVLVYQQVENNILTPKIQGRAVNLSGFFIIVAVTLFGALLGVLGALTAVPLAATVQIFVQELTKARRDKVAAARAAAELHLELEPLARLQDAHLDLGRGFRRLAYELLGRLLEEGGVAAHSVVQRPVRAPVDRNGDTWSEQAESLRGARGVEVLAAAERRAPAPDRDQRQVEVRDKAVHLREERRVAREVDAVRAADRIAESRAAQPADAAPLVVLRVRRAHLDRPDRDRLPFVDLDHALEAEPLDGTREASRARPRSPCGRVCGATAGRGGRGARAR